MKLRTLIENAHNSQELIDEIGSFASAYCGMMHDRIIEKSYDSGQKPTGIEFNHKIKENIVTIKVDNIPALNFKAPIEMLFNDYKNSSVAREATYETAIGNKQHINYTFGNPKKVGKSLIYDITLTL